MSGAIVAPGVLAEALGGLPVTVEEVRCKRFGVRVASYASPGGDLRPSAEVVLAGGGVEGRGECVAFAEAEQDRFVREAASILVSRRGRVEQLLAPPAPLQVQAHAPGGPEAAFLLYARAAIEGALIDLALRQNGRTIATLAGVREGSLSTVISFDVGGGPALRAERIAGTNPGARFKIDVDPRWTEAELTALAERSDVAVLDFKLRGDAPLARRLRAMLPSVIFEDPPEWPGTLPTSAMAPFARDIGLVSPEQVAEAALRGAVVNIKAPRMGGYLAALRGFAAVQGAAPAAMNARAYMGGMFEVGVGRWQARVLGALYAPSAPNDLAEIPVSRSSPVSEDAPRAPSPMTIRFDTPGFG